MSWKAAGRGWAGRAKDSRETCLLPASLLTPSRPGFGSPPQSQASRSRAAGVGEEARGGLQGSAGAPGWSQRPRRTGRSRPPRRERPRVGKPPSGRAEEGPPAAAASAEAKREEPPPPVPHGPRALTGLSGERRGRMEAPPRPD